MFYFSVHLVCSIVLIYRLSLGIKELKLLPDSEAQNWNEIKLQTETEDDSLNQR